jgi:hypothetical protein
MNPKQATRSYETWLRKSCGTVVEAELRSKHQQMRKDPFLFFRATFYLWAQRWPDRCKQLLDAPKVIAVGDLHVGSFGTWRDAEGRLCWGVDDFDECWPLPYTNDLVRLAASVRILAQSGHLTITLNDTCDAILDGYAKTLRNGGCPFVLAEREHYMEKLGIEAIKPPKNFWDNLVKLPVARHGLPGSARNALRKTLPDPKLECKIVRRIAGVGSLGQERFVALAQYDGGWIAREMKLLRPSACLWVKGGVEKDQSDYRAAISSSMRSRDPYQTVDGQWLTRRLSPDSNPIDIAELPKKPDEQKLLSAMAVEAANVHLGSKRETEKTLKDLGKRKASWLRDSAKTMAKSVLRDWESYRR